MSSTTYIKTKFDNFLYESEWYITKINDNNKNFNGRKPKYSKSFKPSTQINKFKWVYWWENIEDINTPDTGFPKIGFITLLLRATIFRRFTKKLYFAKKERNSKKKRVPLFKNLKTKKKKFFYLKKTIQTGKRLGKNAFWQLLK